MNKLINTKPEQPAEEKPKSSDYRDPEEILCAFTDAAMNYNTLKDPDNAYKYVAKKLTMMSVWLKLRTSTASAAKS